VLLLHCCSKTLYSIYVLSIYHNLIGSGVSWPSL